MYEAVINRIESPSYDGKLNLESAEVLYDESGVKPLSIIVSDTRTGVTYSKTREQVTTKESLVSDIADFIGIDPDKLYGLEKAPKSALLNLLKALD